MFYVLVFVFLNVVNGTFLKGFSSVYSDDYRFVNISGANAVRVYAHFAFISPTLGSLNDSLSVQFLRGAPDSFFHQWSESVNWKNVDARLHNALGHNLTAVMEVGEGTQQALPKLQNGALFDPNIVGSQTYLAYMYLYSRSCVRRYHKQGVILYQIENELNEAWLAGLIGQRRFQLIGSMWKNWKFLTELLQTLRFAVKDECSACKVVQNLHSDVPQWVHKALNLQGYFEDAVREWAPILDIVGLDAYPNMVVAEPCLANVTGDRVKQIITVVGPTKPVWVMETSYPVASPSAANATGRTLAMQASCALESFRLSVNAGTHAFFYFKLQTDPGIQAPPGGYSSQDLAALKFVSNLYKEHGDPAVLLQYLFNIKHLKYLESGRLQFIMGGISKGFGLVDSATNLPRPAFFSLAKAYSSIP